MSVYPLILPSSCLVSLHEGGFSQVHRSEGLAKLRTYWSGIPLVDAVQPPDLFQWEKGGPIPVKKESFSPDCLLPAGLSGGVLCQCCHIWFFLTVLPIDLGQNWTYLNNVLLLDWKSGKARFCWVGRALLLFLEFGVPNHFHLLLYKIQKFLSIASYTFFFIVVLYGKGQEKSYLVWTWYLAHYLETTIVPSS